MQPPVSKFISFVDNERESLPYHIRMDSFIRTSVFVKVLAFSLIIHDSVASTTEAPDDGGFFDDDNNTAMFLVLPAMILVYGGCGLIYCVHKCRRYCVRRQKQKIKFKRRLEKEKEKNAFSNTVVTIEDEKPTTSRSNLCSSSVPSTSSGALTLECLDKDDTFESGQLLENKYQETNVDEVEDILQKESVGAVSPGYQGASGYNTASLDKEMQNLDYQLKAAFRLAKTDGKKPVPPKHTTNHDIIKTDVELQTLESKGSNPKTMNDLNETKQSVIKNYDESTGNKHTMGSTSKTKVSVLEEKRKDLNLPNEMSLDDLKSIANVRNTISKEMPKSMPDLIKRPDENSAVLKRVSFGGNKKRIFLSSQ